MLRLCGLESKGGTVHYKSFIFSWVSSLSVCISGDVRKAHSMESLVQTGSDSDRTPIPLSPSVPSKLHRSWSGKKRNGSNSEMDSTGGKGDKNKRSSKYIYDIQGGFFAF